MALTGIVSRTSGLMVLALSLLSCASASVETDPDVKAILTRGGGLDGITETIRISSTSGQRSASRELSNENRSRSIRLPRKTLDSSLVAIESFVSTPPRIPLDTGNVRPLCGDVILTRIEIKRHDRSQAVQEECPHRTLASERYWQRVDSLFRLLASGAR
jgi:hypothetical protein